MLKTLFDRLHGLRLLDADSGSLGGGEGAEVTEPAEPSETNDAGAEEQEVAEPAGDEGRKNDADAAFAEMRRNLEAAQAERDQYRDALGLFFEGDDMVAQARAQAEEKSVDDVKREMAAEQRLKDLQSENQTLTEQINDYEAERRMSDDLKEIQSIDPNVKSLEDLGPNFLTYIAAGLSGKHAYYAAKAQDMAEKVTPPETIGKVNQAAGEKTDFTREEVAGMSQEEVSKNYEAIRRSMTRW